MNNTPKPQYSAREAAFISLVRISADKRYSNLELDAAIKKYALEGVEKKLYTVLVYGTIERQITLDFVIDGMISREISEPLRVLLRLGAYQLLYTDRIPDSAAVNESVELCRKASKLGIKPSIASASGLVNAVLRGIIRQKRDMTADTYVTSLLGGRGITGTAAMSVRYSVNETLVKLWCGGYGEAKTEAILASERHTYTSLRVNTLRHTPSELCAMLNAKCPDCAELSPLSEVGIRYTGSPEVMLEAINSGDCFVEDESSQLTSSCLEAKPGHDLLDCCSAPGGKTFSLGLYMENKGSILARDLHDNKLKLVSKGAERLGLTIVTTAEADASEYDSTLDGRFDRILCDVPCSGSGVITKKPELRFKDPSDYAKLPDLQYRILDTASRYLKPGGRLVYSTCTLNPAENESVVERFAACHDGYEVKSMRTFFPDTDGTDGFFCAVIVRM